MSPGFDLAGVCPFGSATISLALASLGLGHSSCPGDAVIQEELNLREDG